MSKKIPTAGKIWLIFVAVLATVGIFANAASAGKGILYIISAIACLGELFGLVYLLKGKGITYLYVYAGSYIVNAVLTAIASNEVTPAWFVGFVIGVAINIGLTYLSTKETFKK